MVEVNTKEEEAKEVEKADIEVDMSDGTTHKHKGLCSALVIHVFDYGHKASSDKIRTTWENLAQHVKKVHGHDISNELLNKKIVTIYKPEHAQDA